MPPLQARSGWKWLVVLVLLCVLGLFAWELLALHVQEPSSPVSASEAKAFAAIEIPPEAANIRIAGFRQWIAFEQLLRFVAPADVCMRTARAILPGEKLELCDDFETKRM